MAGGVLQGIETIVEDVLHVDPEWHRLGALPGVQEGWAELKVKAAAAISECQARSRRHRQQRLTHVPRTQRLLSSQHKHTRADGLRFVCSPAPPSMTMTGGRAHS